jgi:hypothetical protein
MGGLDEVGLDHEVLIDKVGRVAIVGMDTADPGGGQIDLVDGVVGEEAVDRRLVEKIQLGVGGGEEVGVAQGRETAQQGGADHAAMAGDEDGHRQVAGRVGGGPPIPDASSGRYRGADRVQRRLRLPGHGQSSTARGVAWPLALRKAWRRAILRSSATISAHRAWTVISGTQPRRSLALWGSPRRVSTSVGRK